MKKENYKICIEVLTGLHIGVGNDKPEIGGIDNRFIKSPITNLPYIPGSSLKGKVKCLLETESKNYGGVGDPVIKKYFEGDGNSPTRFIFRDVNLKKEHLREFEAGEYKTEIKTEIQIDRTTGKTTRGSLRTIERVPPGIIFEGEVLVRYDDDELISIKEMLDEGIKLLNNDYLGGSGSRGYGAVLVTIE